MRQLTNFQSALNRIGGDVDFFALTLRHFQSELSGSAKELSDLVDAQLVDQFEKYIHRMKGTAANLGLEKLSEVSKDLELQAKNDNTIGDLSELLSIIGKSHGAIEDYCKDLESQGTGKADTEVGAGEVSKALLKLIMLVDDDPLTRQILSNALKIHYRVISVATGEEVLSEIGKTIPDLILLDVQLPGKSGLQVCKELKANKLTEHIPIIFISAMDEIEDETEGLAAGAVDYIAKPTSLAILNARVKTHLSIYDNIRAKDQANAKLVELNEEKNKMLGMAAHDLRSPLAFIMGMSEVLSMQSKDDKVKASLAKIVKTAENMATLISDMLDLSAIEKLTFHLRKEVCSVVELMQGQLEMYSSHAKSKEIELVTDFRTVPEISIDKSRVSQVIGNILSNAIKYSPPKSSVKIAIFEDQESVVIAVKDSGEGLSPEDQSLLFQAFTKLSTKPTGGEKSTGLGLAICKKVMDAHRGQVRVQSALGAGSEFQIVLPLQN